MNDITVSCDQSSWDELLRKKARIAVALDALRDSMGASSQQCGDVLADLRRLKLLVSEAIDIASRCEATATCNDTRASRPAADEGNPYCPTTQSSRSTRALAGDRR
jgi:hypothetical protein